MDEKIVGLLDGSTSVIKQIYMDLAHPCLKLVGEALGAVAEYCTSFFVHPLQIKNGKDKLLFTKRMNEYAHKLEQISEENRWEVQPDIGVPILKRLLYTTNDDIADLFTTLLANASNFEMIYTAHPSFVGIISRLSPDEARIIKYLPNNGLVIPYCDFKGYFEGEYESSPLRERLTMIPQDIDLIYPNNSKAYFENLVSLGILVDRKGSYVPDLSKYDRIKEYYEFEQFKSDLVPNTYANIASVNSCYAVTDFGLLFIKACVQ